MRGRSAVHVLTLVLRHCRFLTGRATTSRCWGRASRPGCSSPGAATTSGRASCTEPASPRTQCCCTSTTRTRRASGTCALNSLSLSLSLSSSSSSSACISLLCLSVCLFVCMFLCLSLSLSFMGRHLNTASSQHENKSCGRELFMVTESSPPQVNFPSTAVWNACTRPPSICTTISRPRSSRRVKRRM